MVLHLLPSWDASAPGPSFRILDWTCFHRTPLCHICILNQDILQMSSMLCFVPWINHLSPVCWPTSLKSSFEFTYIYTSNKHTSLSIIIYNNSLFFICLILVSQIVLFLPRTHVLSFSINGVLMLSMGWISFTHTHNFYSLAPVPTRIIRPYLRKVYCNGVSYSAVIKSLSLVLDKPKNNISATMPTRMNSTPSKMHLTCHTRSPQRVLLL